MKVKPVDPNAVIRDPVTLRPLPAKGAEVPDNVFWNRRLIAEEVRLLTPAEEAALAKEEKTPAQSTDTVAEKK